MRLMRQTEREKRFRVAAIFAAAVANITISSIACLPSLYLRCFLAGAPRGVGAAISVQPNFPRGAQRLLAGGHNFDGDVGHQLVRHWEHGLPQSVVVE
jgi:hypothetical protein